MISPDTQHQVTPLLSPSTEAVEAAAVRERERGKRESEGEGEVCRLEES